MSQIQNVTKILKAVKEGIEEIEHAKQMIDPKVMEVGLSNKKTYRKSLEILEELLNDKNFYKLTDKQEKDLLDIKKKCSHELSQAEYNLIETHIKIFNDFLKCKNSLFYKKMNDIEITTELNKGNLVWYIVEKGQRVCYFSEEQSEKKDSRYLYKNLLMKGFFEKIGKDNYFYKLNKYEQYTIRAYYGDDLSKNLGNISKSFYDKKQKLYHLLTKREIINKNANDEKILEPIINAVTHENFSKMIKLVDKYKSNLEALSKNIELCKQFDADIFNLKNEEKENILLLTDVNIGNFFDIKENTIQHYINKLKLKF